MNGHQFINNPMQTTRGVTELETRLRKNGRKTERKKQIKNKGKNEMRKKFEKIKRKNYYYNNIVPELDFQSHPCLSFI
jgi:hypothetical protein